jgi:5-dehydro-2-deoxygluconokinase
MAADAGADARRIEAFKTLCLAAAKRVAAGRHGYGILCDRRLGERALHAAAGSGLWIGRPVELPGSRPLQLEIGADFGSALAEWPREHVVKVLVFCHPDDATEMQAAQEQTIIRLAQAARANGLEFLLEIIPSKVGPVDDNTAARLIERFYALGIHPDWWKLEPMRSTAAWAKACDAISRHDAHCRGIVVLGLDAPLAELAESFTIAARFPLVKGFAVGRSIFGDVARQWFAGRLGDAEAVSVMEDKYRTLCAAWDAARACPKDICP